MAEEPKKGTALKVILLIVGLAGTGVLGYLWGSDILFGGGPAKQITPTIDGTIGGNEWKRATHYNFPFYLDVDNTYDDVAGTSNVDGWNYLHVAEDANNYYIAADLCSDRTNNPDGEWFSVLLANQLPNFDDDELVLQSLVNHGYESIFYNVSGDEPYPYYFDDSVSSGYYTVPLIPGVDTIEMINGTMSGDIYDLWNKDNSNLSVQSVQTDPPGSDIEGNYIVMALSINITQKFPHLNLSWFDGKITDLDLHWELTSTDTAQASGHEDFADRFWFSVIAHDQMRVNIGDPGYNDNYETEDFSAGSLQNENQDIDHSFINTTNGMLYITLHCYNELNGTDDASFSIDIDRLRVGIDTSDSFREIIENTISDDNWDLEFSFGASSNCQIEHRMFEFRIAKSEFPDAPDDSLYVALAGYGTMALEGSNYWETPLNWDNGVVSSNVLDSITDFHRFQMTL